MTTRCAIYTRKSTEEGLDQQFNSLDAQREACEAYIASQRHEGWKAVPRHYDDGGYSGGNTQRPALQALMADIVSGKVDLVVVYKIDRLTRSLMDFAKMVEVFDKHQTSFVSVTQHFNTTSSMGRLTLNVLLSFAQFEREVTGERIRDKIAASKKKGLWMGGTVPLGYDVKDKALVVNPKEAAQVRHLFQRYLVLGSVSLLKDELDASGVKSKVRTGNHAKRSGGRPYSRGALYWLLQNRYYLGEVTHAGQHYPGQHQAIVSRELWSQVQQSLADNRRCAKYREKAASPSLLASRIYLANGQRLTPVHTNKRGQRYRYYITAHPKVGEPKPTGRRISLPAHDLEILVEREWKAMLASDEIPQRLREHPDASAEAMKQIQQVAMQWADLPIVEKQKYLEVAQLEVRIGDAEMVVSAHPEQIGLQHLYPLAEQTGRKIDNAALSRTVPIQVKVVNKEKHLIELVDGGVDKTKELQRTQLLQRIALGRTWIEQLVQGEMQSMKALAERENKTDDYIYDILRAGCLSPTLVDRIIKDESQCIPLDALMKPLPLSWNEQKSLLSSM